MSDAPPFRLHPEAAQDIVDIWEFIAADNPLAARRLREEIYAAISALVAFPHQGHLRPDITSRRVRFSRVRDYLIAYVPDQEPLWIIGVIHGRRSPSVIAEIFRARGA